MKAERDEIKAIITRALSYVTTDEARALGSYEPEAISDFVQAIEQISKQPADDGQATKISCPHCACEDTEKLTYFYAETASYRVENVVGVGPDATLKRHIRVHDGSRCVNDGIGSTAGYLHCEACGRETLIPLWVEASFEHY